MAANPILPRRAVVEKVLQDTPDTKRFFVKLKDGEPFHHRPLQCAMLSVPPVGEALFSITSSPTRPEYLEFAVKEVGTVTQHLHYEVGEGTEIGLRGPYGNGFPLDAIKGKDLLFIGGGIGLAPLRSLINYCFDTREDYGKIQIIYGARTPEDLSFKDEIFENWLKEDAQLNVTVDVESPGWDGFVGFVPTYLEHLAPKPEGTVAVTCGPPIMIRFVLQGLEKLGFTPEQIITTLELKMKCGVGKCGRCNIGEKYVCQDGPVFSLAELNNMIPEF
jgi:NAD(P)H-flavin reductase